ncbi:MAG: hypothetical protein Q7S27_02655 [Nanoarchaeota archaeon]|nr:hypothetical protein [Nanoarchaeota archaeon]
MIEPVKRTIKLGQKQCVVCSETFQPASGAQKTCSPECKEKAKELGLNKRGPRNRGGVDPALREDEPSQDLDPRDAGMKQFVNGRLVEESVESQHALISHPTPPPTQTPRSSNGSSHVASSPPELELDLSPLEAYIKALVRQEVAAALSGGVKEAVKAEIAERLKGLLGS